MTVVIAAGLFEITNPSSTGEPSSSSVVTSSAAQPASSSTISVSNNNTMTSSAINSVSSGTTTSSIVQEMYGTGPNSTFPASWVDFCGYPVEGNKTTVFGSGSDSQWGTVNLTEVYSDIVNSSVFQALAAGKTWVTVQWDYTLEGNIADLQSVVSGDFVFLSGGSPNGSAQIDYYLQGGQVKFGYGPLQSTCAG
jgi:hypothetical protein